MAENLRAGLLGAGFMGRTHALNLEKIDGVEIAAICAIPLASAEQLAGQLETAPAVYDDFNRMLDEQALDALVISLPPHTHSGQFEAAAAKGLPIFVEKPIALTMDRARSMVAAAQQAGIVTQVGFQMRFGSAVRALKAMIDAGETGRPTLFDGAYACNSLHSPSWRDRSKSGGQVVEQLIHVYDMALYFLGRPESISGQWANLCHTQLEDYTVEDTSVAILRFANGALASITGSNCAVPMEWKGTWTAVFEKVTATFMDPNCGVIVRTDRDPVERIVIDEQDDTYFEEIRAFVECVRENKPSLAPIEQGCLDLETCLAVSASADQDGRQVQVGSGS